MAKNSQTGTAFAMQWAAQIIVKKMVQAHDSNTEVKQIFDVTSVSGQPIRTLRSDESSNRAAIWSPYVETICQIAMGGDQHEIDFIEATNMA